MRRATVIGIGLAAGAIVLAVGIFAGRNTPFRSEAAADGRAIYAAQCAACHGAELEGQPDWQTRLASGRLPAPPHDASGHTWHHPDGVLFRIVKEGTAAVVGGGYASDMPAFGGILSDDEIRAVLAYIKGTWPERERQFQEQVSQAELGG